MRRPLVVARRAFAFAIMASLLATGACGRGGERADSAASGGAGRSAQAAPLARSSAVAGRAPLPGELAKPLPEYSAEEFYTFVHALGYGGGADRPRKCRGAAGCDARSRLTSARIDAVDGQDDLEATSVPANGVVAVKVRNTGAYDEARYGMRAGAAYEYYAVILPGAGGTARWSLQQLVTTAGARTRTEIATGQFVACAHTSRGGFRANFFSCTDAHISADSVVKLGLMLQDEDSDPMWTRCLSGCCTLEQ